ncbi:unnamed protein product [Adineta steineri]|uniref:Uncharacterized protein n=1 Tax=Adineta steineri TaxID=433720 RepID=A0A818T517_9BILA|nr:unnamed protein product [Adineta steineri]CAF3675029.1 unnamed protein product [Adineta steineri]
MRSSKRRSKSSSSRRSPESVDNVLSGSPVQPGIAYNSQTHQLLPTVSPNMNVQEQDNSPRLHQNESNYNYNNYATTRTIGQGIFDFALLTTNAMQLGTLIDHKQGGGKWIACLVLVCLSIVMQVVLAFLLIIIGIISVMDIIIHVFMSKKNP